MAKKQQPTLAERAHGGKPSGGPLRCWACDTLLVVFKFGPVEPADTYYCKTCDKVCAYGTPSAETPPPAPRWH